MRLTVVIEHFAPAAGGAEAVAVAIVRELVQRGHELHVIARDGVPLADCELRIVPRPGHAAAARAIPSDLVLDWGLNVPADVHRLGGGVTRIFRRHNRLARPLPVRWLAAIFDRLSLRQRRIMAREDALLRDPRTRLLAVSEFVAAQVRQTVPAAAARLTVLHNGVDVERFNPGNRERWRRELRVRLGLGESETAFLFVAHNPRLKNFGLLARVFNELARSVPQARLVVLGKHAPACRRPWLVHAGTTAEPEQFYAAADALLHPTLYDACANAVLEGLAAGLPVVSSDCNGSAEIITPGQDGFVLPVGGGASAEITGRWRAAISRLALEPELRVRIGEAARRLAVQHSFGRYMERFEDYLRDAVAAKIADVSS